jgi:hypothetical protein
MSRGAYVLQVVVLGLWSGAALFFSFVSAPLIFRVFTHHLVEGRSAGVEPLSRELGRRLAGEAVGAIFPWYFGLQLVLAAIAFAVTVFVICRFRDDWLNRWVMGFVFVASLLLIFQVVSIYPRSHTLLESIHRAEASGQLQEAEGLRHRFRRLHGVSQAVNLGTLTSATVAFVLAASAMARPRSAP